ncbi:MAG TPA: tripartite tricarboxylate transporter substrate binding protein [Thermodesulfobacteriota bacterium]|nr:tripartite tricarboxylate transporter substrate binding protein [Thermodesulfobacteriota bacterium]
MTGAFVALLAVAALAGPAEAQEVFPSRPITLVVGFAPGGGADVFSRALAEAARSTIRQPIVIENRPGAGGTNATAYVLGRPADGYTLVFGHAGSTILTPLISGNLNLKWDALQPVARIHGEEEFLFVRADAPWKTIDALIAHARQNPGRVRVGGSAVGGIDSFVILLLEKAAGVDFTYVPFEGGGPALVAFLGGNVDVLVGNVSENVAPLEAKRIVPIAVASAERSPIYPEVPTLKEKGWDVVLAQWRGVLAPKGVPSDRLQILAEGFQKALATPAWQAFRAQSKSVDLFLGPDAFRAFLASEEARFAPLVQELGLAKR